MCIFQCFWFLLFFIISVPPLVALMYWGDLFITCSTWKKSMLCVKEETLSPGKNLPLCYRNEGPAEAEIICPLSLPLCVMDQDRCITHARNALSSVGFLMKVTDHDSYINV